MNSHMGHALENRILNANGMLFYSRNVEPMADPRGERSSHLGVSQ